MVLDTFRFALPSSLHPAVLSPDAVKRFAAFLSDALKEPVDVLLTDSYDHLAKEILTGRADAAWAPPFVCARVEAMGMQIVARGIRSGSSSYRAALLCRKGSGLSLEKLQGSRALWVDKDSVAGYLLPLAFLKSHQLDPQRLFFSQAFAGSYRSALEGVIKGEADITSVFAPAVSGDEQTIPAVAQVLPEYAADFMPIAFTDETPNDGVAVAMGMEAKKVTALETVFLSLPSSQEGRGLLSDVFNAERFELAPRMGYRALYRVALATV